MNHPCLTCSLPDCDDTNSKCALRRAINIYESRRRSHTVTPAIADARRIAHTELYGDGGRPRERRVGCE